jgi:hypothetical protein
MMLGPSGGNSSLLKMMNPLRTHAWLIVAPSKATCINISKLIQDKKTLNLKAGHEQRKQENELQTCLDMFITAMFLHSVPYLRY